MLFVYKKNQNCMFPGLNPVNIEDYLYPKSAEKWKPPPNDPRYLKLQEQIPETEQADYHEETLYQLSHSRKLTEGLSVRKLCGPSHRRGTLAIFAGFPQALENMENG